MRIGTSLSWLDNIYAADAGDHAAGVLPLLGLLAGLQGDGVVGAGPRHRLQRGILQVSGEG